MCRFLQVYAPNSCCLKISQVVRCTTSPDKQNPERFQCIKSPKLIRCADDGCPVRKPLTGAVNSYNLMLSCESKQIWESWRSVRPARGKRRYGCVQIFYQISLIKSLSRLVSQRTAITFYLQRALESFQFATGLILQKPSKQNKDSLIVTSWRETYQTSLIGQIYSRRDKIQVCSYDKEISHRLASSRIVAY